MARAAPLAHVGHLARRFFGSLAPGGPPAAETGWVECHLRAGEVAVWRSMSGPDRRHADGVARRVETALGPLAARPVLAAALLHDAGKVESGLGPFGRAVATVSAGVVGRERAQGWSTGRGFARRVGLYLRHPEIGGALLESAGSDPLTIAWTRQHHLPAERWTVPRTIGDALKAADDD